MSEDSEQGRQVAKRERPATQISNDNAVHEAVSEGLTSKPSAADGISGISKKSRTGSVSSETPLVSVIIPAHNAMPWLVECFQSILAQTFVTDAGAECLEVSIYNDCSSDGTPRAIEEWRDIFRKHHISFVASTSKDWQGTTTERLTVPSTPGAIDEPSTASPVGAGLAKNRAVAQSSGKWLCFIDADDVMMPRRVEMQLAYAERQYSSQDPVLIGCRFKREPKDATHHYSAWCNSLNRRELMLQQFREITVIQPTWFMSRSTFDTVGGYVIQAPKAPHPLPSDLIFFHQLLDLPKAKVDHVPEVLMMYRYLETSVSWRIPRKVIQQVKLRAFERRILTRHIDDESEAGKQVSWQKFTIWGAGRDGKNFLNQLQPQFLSQVRCFCDVDPAKIQRGYYNPRYGCGTMGLSVGVQHPTPSTVQTHLQHLLCRPTNSDSPIKLPVIHFSDAQPPVVICVAMGRTGGALEQNIVSRGWRQGIDYWHFS